MSAQPKPSDVHRQALLAAAVIAAEVRSEAEIDRDKGGAALYRAGWREAADKIANELLDLAGEPRRRRRRTLRHG